MQTLSHASNPHHLECAIILRLWIFSYLFNSIHSYPSRLSTSHLEDSRIWPAINGLEIYHEDLSAQNVFRTFSSDGHRTIEKLRSKMNDATESAAIALLVRGLERFYAKLEVSIPTNAHEYPVNPTNATLLPLAPIKFNFTNPTTQLPIPNETYSITLDSAFDFKSPLVLSSETVFGLLYALQTLSQLVKFGWMKMGDDSKNYEIPIFIVPNLPQKIQDSPVYPYRGILIDTSRHFLPIATILQPHLDLMAAHKLNVLHWHLTDDQSWPWQSTTHPELVAPYCNKCVYTTATISNVVQYARERGIRVIVEVDTPGHTKGA